MKKKKKISAFLLLRLLGIALFIIIISRFNLQSVVDVLKDLDPYLFLYGVFFQLLVLFFKGVRWHIMNDGRKQKVFWVRTLGRFFESYAIGVVTPGRLGELMKAGHEENKHEKAGTFIRVVSERGFDVSLFVLFAVGALLTGRFIDMPLCLCYLIGVAGLALLVFSWLLLSSGSTLRFIAGSLKKLPGKLGSINISVKQYREGTVSIIFVFSLLSNLSYFVSCYFLALSVNLDIPMISVAGGVAIAGLLNMLPITIMGLGTRELIFLNVFNHFSKTSVMAFSITILLVAQIGGGFISLALGQLFIYLDKKELKRKI